MAEEEPIEESSPQASAVRKPSLADLTFRDMWRLLTTYFIAALVCGLVFGLPYALLSGVGFGLSGILGDSFWWWANALVFVGFIFLVVNELPDFLERLGKFLIQMGQSARGLSLLKRVIVLMLFASWTFGWMKYPGPTFFFSILVILPAGYTIDEYRKLIAGKTADRNA